MSDSPNLQPVVTVKQGPGCLIQILWFVFVGWWLGSFAIGAQLLFLGGMALVSYLVGFGLKQNQRSIIALGMGTRNIAAVFAVLMAIPNPDSRLVVMVVLVVPLSVIVAFAAAQLFAARAGDTGAAGDTRP